MAKIKQLLKNIIAHIANFFRKIWNMPKHAWCFLKNFWNSWTRDIRMLWSVAEVAEYIQVFMLSFVLIFASIKTAWKKVLMHIRAIRKTRFQLAFSGGGSWIDREIYFGDIK